MKEGITARVGRIISGGLNQIVDAMENAAPETVMEPNPKTGVFAPPVLASSRRPSFGIPIPPSPASPAGKAFAVAPDPADG
ncbi:MAG: hypothetical protein WD009_08645 [Phycisphaeraceae bacterium]